MIFKKPPETWEQYLPLGNGRLGVMVGAQPCCEVIQLNEEGIWSGGPQDRVNESAARHLDAIRTLIRQGKILEAQEMAFRHLSGRGFNERVYQTAGELRIDFYPADGGGIEFSFPPQHTTPQAVLDSYRSCLDLDEACVRVSYRDEEGISYERTVWASATDDMIFMRATSSEKGKLNFRAYLDRGLWCDDIRAEDGFIFLEDAHGIPFCAGAGAFSSDGSVRAEGFTLCGDNCTDILFFIDIQAWQYTGRISRAEFDAAVRENKWTPRLKDRLSRMGAFIRKEGVARASRILLDRHITEYRGCWDRMELRIGEEAGAGGPDGTGPNAANTAGAAGDDTRADDMTGGPDGNTADAPSVAELFSAFRNDGDVRLVNLYAAFSRYLMIAGSRSPGKLPLTLQGLWNRDIDPPWGSKYTVNINAQMNYWPANMASLGECELPLFTLLERAYENGKDTARRMYGCRGYVIHHNTDFWGDAAPQDAWLAGSYWPLGAAWLATHVWEHYEYGQDRSLLEKQYYLIHEACLFFIDFLTPSESAGHAEDGRPYLVINPSVSPENSYLLPPGRQNGRKQAGHTAEEQAGQKAEQKATGTGTLCEGCQMDAMILTHLFTCQRKAAEAIEGSGGKCADREGREYPPTDYEDFAYVRSHLKPPATASDGSLMEWNSEFEEVEKGHRHISHLYGLFPGISISPGESPALAEAAEKTLRKRLAFGGGHTGWSINFWAALGKGDEAGEAVRKILLNSTLPNLLDNHPPFQIDGNFGALAGILRMLVQCELDEDGTPRIRLLPALPSSPEWQSGFVRGIRIKGGQSLSFRWKDGKPYDVQMSDAPRGTGGETGRING